MGGNWVFRLALGECSGIEGVGLDAGEGFVF